MGQCLNSVLFLQETRSFPGECEPADELLGGGGAARPFACNEHDCL